MKYKIIAMMLLVVCMMTACSKEKKGVPESQVLDKTSIITDYVDEYEIKHDVDKETHIDEVKVIAHSRGRYGTLTREQNMEFQYDKSRDLWTFVDYVRCADRSMIGEVQSLDESAYIAGSPFFGQGATGTSYEITFCAIDFAEKAASIDYEIDASNDVSGKMDVVLYEAEYNGMLQFSIPYVYKKPNWSGTVDETGYYTFYLDYSKGLIME